MTANDFKSWLVHMGLNDTKAATALGCGRNSIRVWRIKGPPRYIGLACSALAMNLPPWGKR